MLRAVPSGIKNEKGVFHALALQYQLQSSAVPKAFSMEDLSDPLGTRLAPHPSH